MLNRRFLWPLMMALFLAPICSAQIRMNRLTVADGLTQGFITSLIQDSKGFIWIGTLDGLNRYDGYSIKRYTAKPLEEWSLRSSSHITCIYEDNQQLLWVGTSEGVYVFEPVKERFFQVSNLAPGLPSEGIAFITGDKYGNIFVQIAGKEIDTAAIYKLTIPDDLKSLLKKNRPAIPRIEADSIAEKVVLLQCIGDTMVLAMNKTNEIQCYNYYTKRFSPFDLHKIPVNYDQDYGILWGKYIGYPFRQKLLSGQDSVNSAYKTKSIIRLGEKLLGLWISSEGPFFLKKTNSPITADLSLPTAQLLKSTAFKQEFTELFVQDQTLVNQFIADQRGVLWVGTGGTGIKKINLKQLSFRSFLEGSSVSTIKELPDGNLWILLFSGKSIIINPQTGEKSMPPWGDAYILEAFIDKDGNQWIIRPDKHIFPYNIIEYWEKGAHKPVVFPETTPLISAVPEKILQDRDGSIWIVAHSGILYRCRPGQHSLEHFSYTTVDLNNVKQLRSTAVMQDSDGAIWIGTNQGLIRMDQCNSSKPSFTKFHHDPGNQKSLSINWVTHILQDPEHHNILWLGTHGGGLNRMDKNDGTFYHYMESAEGLPNNVVYGILPDARGNLWCSTNRGLCKFNFAQNTFVTYQESDGLLNTEFNTNAFMRSRDGYFWFGGVNGLNSFLPEDIRSDSIPPKVALTQIKVLGLPRIPDDEGIMTLSHDENNVLFEFSVLDFANNATNKYRYRLHGIDHDWIMNGTAHTANYAALPPGKYLFELQGATSDSPWNTNSVLFTIIIRPPWYLTWYAYAFYLLLFGSLLLGYIRYREYNIKLEQEANSSRKESEYLKEFDQVKNKFFANIAHELRTPLTVILGLAERLKQNPEGINITQKAEKIIIQGNDLLHLSEQVLDLAKLEGKNLTLHPAQGEIIHFIKEHTEALTTLASVKGVRLTFESDIPSLHMDFDPAQLPKILNNLISNAINHTPAGGNINIHVAAQEMNNLQWLRIQVKDTGEGIDPKDLPHVFDRFYQGKQAPGSTGSSGIGLTLTRDLVLLMKGTISTESMPGIGSTFTVLLPVLQEALPMPETMQEITPKVTSPAAAMPLKAISPGKNKPIILVIEDNKGVVDYLQMCLGSYYQVKFAFNGQEGIDMAIEFVPDIIISDVAMPVKDGFEVLHFVKNDTRTSHIPVVLLTAKATFEDRMTGQERGANAYLTKPFNEKELLLVLQNLLLLKQEWKKRYEAYGQRNTEFEPIELKPYEVEVEDAFIRNLYFLFEKHYTEDDLDLERLCRLLGMSSSQIDRKIKALTDESPMQMLRTFRLQKARKLLKESPQLSVSEVCFRTGFKSSSHFSRLFTKEFGVPPSAS